VGLIACGPIEITEATPSEHREWTWSATDGAYQSYSNVFVQCVVGLIALRMLDASQRWQERWRLERLAGSRIR
jgi:hypothetical protein